MSKPADPHVTFVLSTYNAMPELEGTFRALSALDYDNFRIVVQDGASSDGTLAFLDSQRTQFDILLDSRADTGVSQAYARALDRVTDTDYVMIIAADEQIMPGTVRTLIGHHNAHPEAAVIYGAMDLVQADGQLMQRFQPGGFNLPDIMNCALVPPIPTCMFNYRMLGKDFHYTDATHTCPDYEFWLRLALKYEPHHFVCVTDVLARALADRTSMSFRAEAYLDFSRDKTAHLRSHLERVISSPHLQEHIFCQNGSDIYCWAADMVMSLEGPSQTFADIVSEAVTRFGDVSTRLQDLIHHSEDLQAWMAGDRTAPPKVIQRDTGPKKFTEIGRFDHHAWRKLDDWQSTVDMASDGSLALRCGPTAWSYSWELPLDWVEMSLPDQPVWLAVDLDVTEGSIGVGLLRKDQLLREVSLVTGPHTAYCQLKAQDGDVSLVLRNGGIANSSATIKAVYLVTAD